MKLTYSLSVLLLSPSLSFGTVTAFLPPGCKAIIPFLGDCTTATGCCASGSYCFQKNSQHAQCLPTCTPGVHSSDPAGQQTPWTCNLLGPLLRDLGQANGIYIGAAETPNFFNNPQYAYLYNTQFSITAATNECKWYGILPNDQFNYQFGGCDQALNRAEADNMQFRGHNLCWGAIESNWLNNQPASSYNATQKTELLQTFITTVLNHYGNRAFAWDVVNEALSDFRSAFYKSNYWYPDIQDYVNLAFTTAASVRAPNVKLFYNDYHMESSLGATATKANRLLTMVKDMKKANVPIDGIGVQTHVDITYNLVEGLRQNMVRLGNLGLDIHITEMDVSTNGDFSTDAFVRQAELYGAIIYACITTPSCKAFETWGFVDDESPTGVGGVNSHLFITDSNGHYQPKLAYQAMVDTLSGNTTWVTNYYARILAAGQQPAAPPAIPPFFTPKNVTHTRVRRIR